MEYKTIFKRYEVKYILTADEFFNIKKLIQSYMEPDTFSFSTINNIYFDTPSKLFIRRSIEKPVYKEKLRLRSYNQTTELSPVFIEIKKKYDGVVYKRRISTTEKEAMNYLCNRIPLSCENQISREIDYIFEFYKNLEPYLFISYNREAFFCPSDPNLRITFDKDIIYRDYDLSLINGAYGNNLLQPEQVLMEVKTALGYPTWLNEFLNKNKIFKSSFSKYGNAYKEINSKINNGGNNYVA